MCGGSAQEFCGPAKEIATPNFSTVKPPNDLGKTQYGE